MVLVTFGSFIPDHGSVLTFIILRVVKIAVYVVITIMRVMAKASDTTRLPKFVGSNPPISL